MAGVRAAGREYRVPAFVAPEGGVVELDTPVSLLVLQRTAARVVDRRTGL